MNFSFASAPTTPFITQVDGRQAGDAGRAAQFLSPAAGLTAPLSASAAPISCATDPLNDIGSPVALQYFLGLNNNSPLVMTGDSMSLASPSAAAAATAAAVAATAAGFAAAPKASQLPPPPALIVTSSPAAAAAATLALSSTVGIGRSAGQGYAGRARSPAAGDREMPGMFRPAEVFKTPEIHALPDTMVEQRTPELPLFEDADAVAAGMPLSALSPRTRTAQAGLTLLAASATYARDAGSLTPEMAMLHTTGALSPLMHAPHRSSYQMAISSTGASPAVGDSQVTVAAGSPFLNAGGVNATLMSQPHNSLAQHVSPSMVDHGGPGLLRRLPAGPAMYGGAPMGLMGTGTQAPVPGMHTLGGGRLARNRSLLRQSSGLTSASFHNDLVPAASESFFAPLDEVCADPIDQSATAPLASPLPPLPASAPPLAMQNARHMQHIAATNGPPMGTQFSPVMSLPASCIHPAQSRPPPPRTLPQQQQQQSGWPPAHTQQQPQQQYHQLARSASPYAQHPGQYHQPHTNGARPGEIFSHMPTLGLGPGSNGQRPRSTSGSMELDMDDDSQSESVSDSNEAGEHKRRRTGKALHKRDQQRRFNCDVCDRSFARQYNLKTHRLTHFPDLQESRPYKCAHCPKAFTRRHDLQRHAILHQRSGKHSCPACGRGFPRKDSLRTHLKLECTGDFNPADIELSPVL